MCAAVNRKLTKACSTRLRARQRQMWLTLYLVLAWQINPQRNARDERKIHLKGKLICSNCFDSRCKKPEKICLPKRSLYALTYAPASVMSLLDDDKQQAFARRELQHGGRIDIVCGCGGRLSIDGGGTRFNRVCVQLLCPRRMSERSDAISCFVNSPRDRRASAHSTTPPHNFTATNHPGVGM